MILYINAAIKSLWAKYRIRKMKFGLLGKNVKIRPNFRLGHTEKLYLNDNIVLGENIFINAHGGVEIGSGTITGPDVMIFSVNHIYETTSCLPFAEGMDSRKVVIGENCWIGGRTFICPGVELGEGCVVAGGSVVTKSFPALSVIGGNPAKLIKTRSQEKYLKAKDTKLYHSDISK